MGYNNKIGCIGIREGKKYMENREYIEYRGNKDKF